METPDFISKSVLSGAYYFFDLNPDPSDSVTIVCGGRERCGPNYRVERETFAFWSVEYVVAGQGRIIINGDSFPVGPGTLFRYGPGVAHTIEVDTGSVIDKVFVDLVGADVASWWTGPWQTLKPLHVPTHAGIHRLFEDLQFHGRRGGPAAPRLCALICEQIAVLAASEAVDVDRSHSAAWATYVRCRGEIETSFLVLRTLGDIADLCRVTDAWLCRLFSQFDAESPYQFLVRLKMSHAASRLTDRNILIKQVAHEIGYNPYHFSRVFKKATGFSPEVFRQFESVRREDAALIVKARPAR